MTMLLHPGERDRQQAAVCRPEQGGAQRGRRETGGLKFFLFYFERQVD